MSDKSRIVEVENLLKKAGSLRGGRGPILNGNFEKTAYNCLITYTEIGFIAGYEGDNLLDLCLCIVGDAIDKNLNI